MNSFVTTALTTRRLHILWLGTLALVALAGCGMLDREADSIDPELDNVANYGTSTNDTFRLGITADGMYSLSLEDLAAEGGTLTAFAPDNVSLTHAGDDVAFHIDGDRLIFYGLAPDDRYVSERPYLLQIGSAGRAMTTSSAADPSGDALASIPQTIYLEEDHVYNSSARTAGADQVWYWTTVQIESTAVVSASLPTVANEPAQLTIGMWGKSFNREVSPDHDFDLLVNGQQVAFVQWDGETRYDLTVDVPAGLLRNGNNTITFDNSKPGATLVDITLLDSVAIDYMAPSMAVDDRLSFFGVGGSVTLSGFTAEPLLFDVANPFAPVLLTDWQYSGDVTIGVNETQHVTAVGPAGYLKPTSMRALRDSDWRDTANGADLLIITTDRLAPALAPLVEARETQGLSVAVVPVAEIYDEFGFGATSPVVLQEFVTYTYNSWTVRPRYLFLVGDTTYDYRNNLGLNVGTGVPSMMVEVQYSGETVSDTRIADVDGDLLPEMAVGRWPVTTTAQVEDLVERTLAYENGSAPSQIIATADGTEAQFATISDDFFTRSSLENSNVTRLYGAPAADVTNAWNAGAWLVTYTGHGSLDKWGKDDVLSEEAVADIGSRQTPPIVLQFTCLSGFFAHPTVTSLSETLLLQEDGPVLLLGASSLTLSSHQTPLAIGLLNALQAPSNVRIGDALQQAKRGLDVSQNGIREVSDTFGLLGDPSALIVRPENLATN